MKKILTILFLYAGYAYGQATGTPMGNYPSGGVLGTAAATVDVLTFMKVQQTTSGQVISVPSPTLITGNKNITITNSCTACTASDTVSVMMSPGGRMRKGKGFIYRWMGNEWNVVGGVDAATETDPKWTTDKPSYATNSSVTSGLATKEPTVTAGTTGQYYRGDKTWQTFPSFPSEVDPVWTAAISSYYTKTQADARYLQSYTETDPQFDTKLAGKTTTNLTEGTNQYFTTARARASFTAGTGISITSGVIANTAPAQTVTLTAGRGITISGSFPNFTIAMVAPTISTTARALNSNFTPNATKETFAFYTITCTVTNPLLAGTSTASVFLEYSTNAGSSWNPVTSQANSSGVGVAVAVALTNGQTGVVSGVIPAGALARLRSTTAGTASVTILSTFEMVY